MGKIIFDQALWSCVCCCLRASVTGSLLERPETQTFLIGQRVVMKCRTSLSFSVDWHFIPENGKREEIYSSGVLSPIYSSEYKIEKVNGDGTYNLVIESVAERHAGEYICIDDEGLGSDSASATLKVSNDKMQNHSSTEKTHEENDGSKDRETDDKGDNNVVSAALSTTAFTKPTSKIPIIVGLTVCLTIGLGLLVIISIVCYFKGPCIRRAKLVEVEDQTQTQSFLHTDVGKAT